MRARLQRTSDRWLFGERDDPYAVISSVGEGLDASDPARVLPTLAETVAQTLRLSYVAIALEREDGLEVVAQRGELRGEPVTLPLTYGGDQVGQLSLGPRTPGERFSPRELRLFDDIARQAAIAAHAVRLSEDLQRSREQLITTREEERRRLHRDLHDGLGPTLAGISLQVGSARLLLRRDLEAADRLLAQLVGETTTAIADVRRLIYALRPPALDELGLVPALRMQAERFPGLEVRVLADEPIAAPPSRRRGCGIPDRDRGADERLAPRRRLELHDHARCERAPRARGDGRRHRYGTRLAAGRRRCLDPRAGRRARRHLRGRERRRRRHPRVRPAPVAGGDVTALRVLVADDHPLFRAGLLTALELSDSVEVVGEARTATRLSRPPASSSRTSW